MRTAGWIARRSTVYPAIGSPTVRTRGARAETLGVVALICHLVCVSEAARAATFTASLPNLIGTYEYASGSTAIGDEIFDLGVQFSEISEARLSITFSASTGIFESCSGQGCTPVARDLFPGLVPWLRDPFALFSPNGSGRSGTDLVDVQFEAFWRPTDFDRLLDGSDRVAMGLDGIVCVPENVCSFVTSPVATVSAARLTITGTVVPEPSTLALVATGLLGVAAARRHGSGRSAGAGPAPGRAQAGDRRCSRRRGRLGRC